MPRAQSASASTGDVIASSSTPRTAPRTPITRKTQSCDACRSRKIRCDRSNPPEAGTEGGNKCSHCRNIDVPCIFTRVPKRRGPKNKYATIHSRATRRRRSNESSLTLDATSQTDQSPQLHDHGDLGWLVDDLPLGLPLESNTSAARRPQSPTHFDAALSPLQSQTSQGADNDAYLPFMTNANMHGPSESPTDFRATGHSTQQLQDPQPTAYPLYPYNPANVLDNMLPRGLLYKIIDLHFEYVYPLTPLLHRPSFTNDLDERREDRPGQDEWVALVLAVVAVTIAQLPHPLMPLPQSDARSLVQRCYRHVCGWQIKEMEDFSVIRGITLVFHGMTATLLQKPHTSATMTGIVLTALSCNHFHLELTYSNYPPLQRELWRRLFWIVYYGDRTMSLLDNRLSQLHEDDCAGLSLPSEVDDAYLSDDGYLPQPPEHVSVLSGFVYSCKLFRLLGEVLDKRRRDRRTVPRDSNLTLRQLELNQLQERISTLMDNCPAPLRLEVHSPEQTLVNLLGSLESSQFALPFPLAPLETKDAFLVQQANIYVTQQMAQIVILQYRAELGLYESVTLIPHPMTFEEERDKTVSRLLTVLERIPLNIIAVNTRWLVRKVRFVASTLLDAVDVETPEVAQLGRAHRYLGDFLRILGELESLYSPVGLG